MREKQAVMGQMPSLPPRQALQKDVSETAAAKSGLSGCQWLQVQVQLRFRVLSMQISLRMLH